MLLKIFIWIITIVVLLLSTFFVIGLMVGDTSVPSLRGAGPQDAEERVRELRPCDQFPLP
jgi:ABC-type dipeptide/oligopeptide/nickel transport system permease component